MKKIFTILLCFSILCSLTPCSFATEIKNVSLGKPVSASGNTFDCPEENLTDGRQNTMWSSNSGSCWAIIDLQDEYLINRIEVSTRTDLDQDFSRGNFTIECSNDLLFAEGVVRIGSCGQLGFGETVTFDGSDSDFYRYVRLSSVGYTVVTQINVFADTSKVSKDTASIKYSDLSDSIGKKYSLLQSLGIPAFNVEGTELSPDLAATRGEATAFIMAVIKANAQQSEDAFNDIENCYGIEAINTAAALGYIKSGGEFNPDGDCSFEFAAELMLLACGLGRYVDLVGRDKILSIASQMGYLKNTSGGDIVSKKDLINLSYNMLLSGVYNILPGASNGYELKKSNDTIMSKIYKLKYKEGIVTANSVTDIDFLHASSSFIRVEGMEYSVDSAEYDNLIGHKVRIYYDEERNCVYAYSLSDALLIDAEDIVSWDDEYVYESNSRQKRAKINSAYSVIYNGIAEKSIKKDLFIPKNGNVTLIDNDDDGTYDIINIFSYTDYIVDSVSYTDNAIIFKDNDEKYISFNDSSDIIFYYNGEKVSSIGYVSKKSVVSVARSIKEEMNIVYISTNQKNVHINSVNDEIINADEKYEYSLISDCKALAGRDALVYINSFGKIVYITYVDNLRYAFATRISYDDSTGERTYIKLINDVADGTYTLADKVKINGTALSGDSKSTYNILYQSLSENGDFKPQMLKYRSDINLNIKEIYTISGSADMEDGIKERYSTPDSETLIWNLEGVIDASVPFDSSTKVFVVNRRGNDYDFAIHDGSWIQNGTRINITQGFDGKKTEPLKAILMLRDAKYSYKEDYVMFDDISMQIDSDDEIQYAIGANGKKYVSDNPEVFSQTADKLKKGMILCLNLSDKERIVDYSVIYDPYGTVSEDMKSRYYVSESSPTSMGSEIYSDDFIVCGTISEKENGYLVVEAAKKDFIFSEGVISNIVLYKKETDEVLTGEISELYKQYKTVMKISSGRINVLFAYVE